MEKATLGFCMYKLWQILKRFAGTFRRAQTLKLGGVLTGKDIVIWYWTMPILAHEYNLFPIRL